MGIGAEFDAAVQEISAEIFNGITREAAKTAYNQIQDATPVDTGQAAANWNANPDQPSLLFIEGDTDRDGARARAHGNIDSVDFFNGDTVQINNAAPYIEVLQGGSSDQAPDGMTIKTESMWEETVEEAAKSASE